MADRKTAREIEAARNKVITTNRVAYRDYEIVDTLEAGIVLTGSEVKALRETRVRLTDAFARVVNNELWLIGLHIPPYSHSAGVGGHDPDRHRKLLVHRHQMATWNVDVEIKRLTMVPLQIYFKEGRAKVELGLGKGRKSYDKRQVLAKRDADLEARRGLAESRRVGR